MMEKSEDGERRGGRGEEVPRPPATGLTTSVSRHFQSQSSELIGSCHLWPLTRPKRPIGGVISWRAAGGGACSDASLSLSPPQLCWQKTENDDLLGGLLFTPCPRWMKIKLEFYELGCLSWHLYELWARLGVIYVYCSAGKKKPKQKNPKWSGLRIYSNAPTTADGETWWERRGVGARCWSNSPKQLF